MALRTTINNSSEGLKAAYLDGSGALLETDTVVVAHTITGQGALTVAGMNVTGALTMAGNLTITTVQDSLVTGGQLHVTGNVVGNDFEASVVDGGSLVVSGDVTTGGLFDLDEGFSNNGIISCRTLTIPSVSGSGAAVFNGGQLTADSVIIGDCDVGGTILFSNTICAVKRLEVGDLVAVSNTDVSGVDEMVVRGTVVAGFLTTAAGTTLGKVVFAETLETVLTGGTNGPVIDDLYINSLSAGGELITDGPAETTLLRIRSMVAQPDLTDLTFDSLTVGTLVDAFDPTFSGV